MFVEGEVSLSEFTAAVAIQNDAVATAIAAAWEAVIDFTMNSRGVQSLAKQFKMMDTDGSGDLDFEELGKGLAKCGVRLTPREFRLFSHSLDVSGDGKVIIQQMFFVGAC